MKRNDSLARRGGANVVSQADRTRTQTMAAAAAVKKFVGLISLDVDMDHTRSLQLRERGITVLPPHLGSLLHSVRKLDLAHNAITDVAPLATLAHLSNLTLAYNTQLQSLAGLDAKQLVVLNVANCALISLRGLEASAHTLRTLIANDNSLRLCSPSAQFAAGDKTVDACQFDADVTTARGNYAVLQSLSRCETIVLSRNARLCSLVSASVVDAMHETSQWKDQDAEPNVPPLTGRTSTTQNVDEHSARERRAALAEQHPLSVFGKLPELKKLSLSGCHLDSLPARWFLPKVTELRLAHNALHSLQPEGVIVRSLKMLDISDNQLDTLSTLRRCRFLQQLHIRGNPLMAQYVAAAADQDGEAGAESHTTAQRQQRGIPPTLQRALRGLFTHLASVDGQALPHAKRARDEVREEEDKDAVAEDEAVVAPDATVVKDTNGRRHREIEVGGASRALPVPRSNHDTVRAEAERTDVVLMPPVTSAEAKATPIVRRDRVLLSASSHTPHGKTAELTGSDAVTQLLKQKHVNDTWQ